MVMMVLSCLWVWGSWPDNCSGLQYFTIWNAGQWLTKCPQYIMLWFHSCWLSDLQLWDSHSKIRGMTSMIRVMHFSSFFISFLINLCFETDGCFLSSYYLEMAAICKWEWDNYREVIWCEMELKGFTYNPQVNCMWNLDCCTISTSTRWQHNPFMSAFNI